MNDQTKENQLKRTFDAFRERPKTMLEVAKETGILRSNICRYVAQFRKQNKIAELHQGTCSISGHKAAFYTTDPKLIPEPGQTEMFSDETKSKAYMQ